MATFPLTLSRVRSDRQRLLPVFLAVALAIGFAAALLEPWLVFAAVFVAAAATLVLIFSDAAAVLFVALLYLNVPVVAARFWGVPEVIAASAVLVLLLPRIGHLVWRGGLVVTSILPLMVVYLGVLLLSAVLSPDAAATRPAVLIFLSEGLLLFLLVTQIIRTPQMLRQAFWAVTLAAATMGAVSIGQELTGTYKNNYGGFAQIDSRDISNVRAVDIEFVPGQTVRPRLAGPIGEKNRYAQVLIMALPLAALLALTARRRAARLIAAFGVLAIVGGVLLTFSRGAAVTLLPLGVLLVVLGLVRPRQAVAATGIAILVVILVAPSYAARLQSITGVAGLFSDEAATPDSAIVGRATENLAALLTFADYPLTGVGPGRFSEGYAREYGNELGLRHLYGDREAHNLYLAVAAETGTIGLLAFLAIVGASFVGLWRRRRLWLSRRPEYAQLATAVMLSLFAYLSTGVFLHLSYQRFFWLLIALAASAIWVLRPAAHKVPDPA